MFWKRKIIRTLILGLFLAWLPTVALGLENNSLERVYGENRYETMVQIALQLNPRMSDTLVLASGNDFPDALAGVPLAHQKNAPILLVDSTPEQSQEAFSFIREHFEKQGTVYILGGEGVIPNSFVDALINLGIQKENILRLSGADRYQTAIAIARHIEHKRSKFYIVSGEDFPDALSASVLAATTDSNGVPILLVPSGSNLPDALVNYLNELPGDGLSQSFEIIGGEGAVSEDCLEALKGKVKRISPDGVVRKSGIDRYETMKIVNASEKAVPHIYLASGENYPDALAGAVLAARDASPIILVNETMPNPTFDLLLNYHALNERDRIEGTQVTVLGGSGVLSNSTVMRVDYAFNYGQKASEESQPRMLSQMLIDMESRLEELLDLAKKAQSAYLGDRDKDTLGLALVLVDQAKNLASFASEFNYHIADSPKAAAVNEILKEKGLSLEQLKSGFVRGSSESEQLWQEIMKLALEANLSKGEINAVLNQGFQNSLYGKIVKELNQKSSSNHSNGGGDVSNPPPMNSHIPADEYSSVSYVDNGNKTATIMMTVKDGEKQGIANLTAADFIVKLRDQSYVVGNTLTFQGFTNKGNGEYEVIFNPGFAVNEVVEIIVKGVSIQTDLSVVISDPGESNPSPVDPNVPVDEKSSAGSVDNGDKTATISVTVKNAKGEGISNLTAADFTVKLRGVSYVVGDTPTLQGFMNKGNGEYEVIFNPGFAVDEVVEIIVKGVSIVTNLSVVISDPGGTDPPSNPDIQSVFVDGGEEHSLALQGDGTVLAWGTNLYGQLGNAETPMSLDKVLPVQVSDLTNVVSVATGSYHSLALKADGTVWGWGRNELGELGLAQYKQITPYQIPSITNVVAIAAGAYFSLALKNDGTVWAWGNNYYGQLGKNIDQSKSSTPVQVSGLTDMTAIAAGEDHSIAVKKDGTVWTWGNNSHGQSGNGNLDVQKVYEPVQVSGITEVKDVAAGYAHSLALKKDGTVWAWGLNNLGQIGRWDNYNDQAYPIQVTGMAGISAIAAGWEWSLAVKDGQIYAWGDNNWGQLGDGTSEDRTSIVQVNKLTNVKGVSAGKEHSLAILEDGTVWTWGRNNKGQLGVSIEESNVPVRVGSNNVQDFRSIAQTGFTASFTWTGASDASSIKIQQSIDHGETWTDSITGTLSPGSETATVQDLTASTLYLFKLVVNGGQSAGESNIIELKTNSPSRIVAIAAGSAFSMALKDDGTVWSWGYNNGRLGNGDSAASPNPVRVKDLTNVTEIAAGDNHGMAVRNDGTAMAWGSNEWGQLGVYTSLNISNIPVKVGLADIERLAGGSVHSLGVKNDGTAYAWGRNYYGSMGTGSTDDYRNYTPSKLNIKDDLGNPIEIVEVAGGEDHSVALTQLGTVWTWGWNSEGQLGNGTTENNFLPTEISNLRGITAIAAGKDHTLALKDDGTVWTWGDNSSGQIGDNTQTDRSQPIQVTDLDNVKAIAAGDSFSVALKSDGSIWVWGMNKTSKTLGIGNNYGSLVPAQVLASEGGSYFTGVSAIAAGNNHLLALCQDGSVWMWGIEHLYNSDVVIPYPQKVSGFPTNQ